MFRSAYPCVSRTTAACTESIREYSGLQLNLIKEIRSDNAPELLQAVAEFEGIVHTKCVPHAHQTHSHRERQNQIEEQGTRAILLASGLDYRFWSYAVVAFCHAFNVHCLNQAGVTPFAARYPDLVLRHYPLNFGCSIWSLTSQMVRSGGASSSPVGSKLSI